MQKDLINDVKKLAQEILQIEEGMEVTIFRQKAQEINEKLTILNYLISTKFLQDETISEIVAVASEVVEEIIPKTVKKDVFEQFNIVIQPEIEEDVLRTSFELSEPVEKSDQISEMGDDEDDSESLDDIFVPTFEAVKEDFSLKEEFKNTVSLDDTENLFITKKTEIRQLSLNDRLLSNSIQIGLNDRIAFVNQLFNFSQSEFNKVLSILNGFKTEKEAKNYINITLKHQYGWQGKEEVIGRFLFLVERKFL